jgi:hypothetical protein
MRAFVGGFGAECGCSIAFDTKDSAISTQCAVVKYCIFPVPTLSVSGVPLMSVYSADHWHRCGFLQNGLFLLQHHDFRNDRFRICTPALSFQVES